MTRYWIGVASSGHVERGVQGGFAQLGHGKAAPLRRLQPGDWIAYYAPRSALTGGAPVRAFVALGVVQPGEAYQAEQAQGFAPFRRAVAYDAPARAAPIAPLLEQLEVTRGKGGHWGMVFRRGVLEVSRTDFATIASAMGVALPAPERPVFCGYIN